MARRWSSVRVELLGGRGEQLWPYPGRVFAVGPAHTFADLARAIDNAFARWDLSHLSLFTLADGRVVTDAETGAELATSALGVMPTAALDIEVTKVMQTVKTSAQFRYVFDLGDDWTHCCTVDAGHVGGVDVACVDGAAVCPVVAEVEDVAELCTSLDRLHHLGDLDVQRSGRHHTKSRGRELRAGLSIGDHSPVSQCEQ